MNALPSHAPSLTPPPGRVAVSLEELAMCVRALDPGSRALLDLSLRRRLPFEALAGFLQTDPFDLARRRARAVARIAAELDLEGPGVVATVRAALGRLPDDAWGVPLPPRARTAAPVVQADQMAEAARALMVRLREQRARARMATARAAAPDPREQPTVEMDAVIDEPVAAELAELEAGAGDVASVTVEGPEAPRPVSLAAELAAIEAGAPADRRSPTADLADAEMTAEPGSLAAELAAAEAAAGDEATIAALGPADEAGDAPVELEVVEADAVVDAPMGDDQPTVETEAIRVEPAAEPEPEPIVDAEDQPTVESDAIQPWSPTRPPIAAHPMAGAFSRHPAFAVEAEETVALPPLAQALARAAANEREAAEMIAAIESAVPAPPAPSPASEPVRPAAPLSVSHADARAPRRRLARGGLLLGLLLAIARLLLGRR
jgi:hypothetical protein